jgi:predicted nuclease of restriction endonuclease-like (RecB) superfamily
MNKKEQTGMITLPDKGNLFDKVVTILEQARANVVRIVNSNMIIAYWLIGKMLVEELQGGEERAVYGKRIIDELSKRLTERYGKGYSPTNLKYFRLFYQTYAEREPVIRHKACDEFGIEAKIHKPCGVLAVKEKGIRRKPCDVLEDLSLAVGKNDVSKGFSSVLSWSHYRALSKVENKNERLFYEIEAEKEGWSVPVLERQVHSFLFARLLKSKNKSGVMELAKKGQEIQKPEDAIKNPYVLDFLGLNHSKEFFESDIEQAIIDNLQSFILELGKGFAFVARQKRLQYDDEFYYVDLVFYNCILKCYMLIDLKIGKLTHKDVGQMDSYVRMYDDLFTAEDDNPTIGLILCAEKNETVAKYSVLQDSKKLFVAKYMLYLPTEEELRQELIKELNEFEGKR